MQRARRNIAFVLAAIALFAGLSDGKPFSDSDEDYYADDYENYSADDDYLNENEKVVYTIPKFTTKSTDQLVNEGDTIKLPCLVDNIGAFVLIWHKNQDIVALGSKVYSSTDPRIKLETNENGNTLVISLADQSDEGQYMCQISANRPTELTHNVRIRVAPEIRPEPTSGLVVVQQGEPATLACNVVKGSPAPAITWTRKERTLPSGEEAIRAESLTFRSASRHHSGNYICTADNGFAPVSATIRLDVQHAPTIEQEETFIHTGEHDETEIICTVHASPRADVVWLKNGQLLDKDQGIVSSRGNRHVLLLPGIKNSAYGQYTCRATNELGQDEKTTEVSGRAGPVNIKTGEYGAEPTRYTLDWVAESLTPVVSFRLQFRKLDLNADAEDDWSSELEVSPRRVVADADADDATNPADQLLYSGQHVFEQLSPATHYEVRVATENGYGYSDYAKPFVFGTKGAEDKDKQLMEETNEIGPVQQPSTGGSLPSGVRISAPWTIALALAAAIFLSQNGRHYMPL